MTDQQIQPPRYRKLRNASETIKQRAEHSSKSQPKKSKFLFLKPVRNGMVKFMSLGFWRPLKFVGHYIIPPYFRNSWRELRLVTWPGRKQTLQLTWAVILFSTVLGAIVASLDYGLGNLFKEVIIR